MTMWDLGATWQEHLSSKKLLIKPATCMASLIDVDDSFGLVVLSVRRRPRQSWEFCSKG
ncbi:hypothetical protein DSM3645_18166 [Blastopirellula marina DSM 3645]|uniref:Uncharacterized protein n=1 Tax=Blastopirellula marina DSM 3645 TaxID=314230 RepID=A3ZYS7_9BACT|nr:hypothetical protein DSM3645_18166 [Blastopirellula marina DSM 3645]